MILVIHAHPYPSRSRATAALLAALEGLPDTEVRRLYDLYPDFDIDVAGEHEALRRAKALVLLHPLYWYSVPALLKHWFDAVLLTDVTQGAAGSGLEGKPCLWATVTGRGEYVEGGVHGHRFEAFAAPIEMTARYCGLRWQPPFVLHEGAALDDAALANAAAEFRARVAALAALETA
jgi:glutathione-regulated potassium-efflux system ancillary protein KefF